MSEFTNIEPVFGLSALPMFTATFDEAETLLRIARPYVARLFALRVPLSNAKARQELGWAPMYPSYREGLRQTVARAA